MVVVILESLCLLKNMATYAAIKYVTSFIVSNTELATCTTDHCITIIVIHDCCMATLNIHVNMNYMLHNQMYSFMK